MTRMRLRAPTHGAIWRMRRIAESFVKIAEHILHFVQAISRLFENFLHVLVAQFDLSRPLGYALRLGQVLVQKPFRSLCHRRAGEIAHLHVTLSELMRLRVSEHRFDVPAARVIAASEYRPSASDILEK